MLTFRGLTRVWPIYLLAALGAAVGAFDLPARQALVPTLVPREHLPNAISLNTIMFQTASVVGPSLGGIVIAAAGVGWVYVAQRGLVRLRDRRAAADARRAGASAVGRRIARRRVAARGARRAAVRLPLAAHPLDDAARFLRDVLLVGDRAAADLRAGHPARRRARLRLAVRGAGGRRGRHERGAWCRWSSASSGAAPTLLWAVAGYGLATVVFGLSRSFWLTFVCLALTGATDTVSMVIRNIIRQLETPDRLRGRMTGVNMVFFMGGPQLGELEAGAVANWFGAPFSVDQRRRSAA